MCPRDSSRAGASARQRPRELMSSGMGREVGASGVWQSAVLGSRHELHRAVARAMRIAGMMPCMAGYRSSCCVAVLDVLCRASKIHEFINLLCRICPPKKYPFAVVYLDINIILIDGLPNQP